ncbi:orotidine-5'-phosphate decarboxylase (plasmid) [Legionella adelaidensis]|uniref:Orotidine 5'-phosphate decarboxylase n=1 Tax=Legionella adelaidensis TaxID=45056 RepID=A0A0W0R560_9GAMM|nr:orotidine-5'-phosphate decarboxylase [Legionella adelaidensis]KTC66214.1 orotidine 5`-phosphate decarboxylase [Legionella adelaidensis]VEH81134.1 orotidine-5'-phosphate decarboxylase [Legionella adelaidensis]
MEPRLIIALDFSSQKEVWDLLYQLNPSQCAVKVGFELFTQFGPELVKQLVKENFKVFLDLKFHDIPNTVAKACKVSADLGVWMLNVHALGGPKMMSAAHDALSSYGQTRPLLIAVTILTSTHESELQSIGLQKPLVSQVIDLALMAQIIGLDGVVCSAHEAALIKNNCNQGFLTVTPGIRLKESKQDDQTRIITPEQAIKEGSDYLVIGRPITQSPNPKKVVEEILLAMKQ